MLRAPFVFIWNALKALVFALKWALFRLGRFLTRKKPRWVHWHVPARHPFGPPRGVAALFQDTPSFLDARERLLRLADDPDVDGLLITADGLSMGSAHVGDLADLADRLRDSGKAVLFHSHSLMGREYRLALAADQILVTPGAHLYLFGLRIEQFFAAPLLERLGVAAQFVHLGAFKTAAHRFIHEEGTSPQRLAVDQLLTSLAKLQESHLAERRGLADDELPDLFGTMPIDDQEAIHRKLIDARWPRRKLRHWIASGHLAEGEQPPSPEEAEKAAGQVIIRDLPAHVGGIPRFQWVPLFRHQPAIAVMDLSGMIVMPDTEIPGHSAATIDPKEVLPALRALKRARHIRAVVLHINSPGGSAIASEIIWDAIGDLGEAKPVIAYMSDVAASGGYYLSVAAHGIICRPETITGSIGVIAGKFSLPGALEHLGIHHETFARHESSRFMSLSEPLSEDSLENLRRDARAFYRQFLRRVGESRGLPRRRLHRFARGRVYTGVDAHRRGLVDKLGGFEDAVDLARELASLDDRAPLVFQPHRKVSLPALLRTRATSAIVPDTLQELRGIHAIARREPLLALLPLRLT